VQVAPRGAATVGAVETVAHLDAKGMLLQGTLFLRHPGRDGVVGNGEFSHILRPVCSEVFCAQTYPHGARLTPVLIVRRA